MSAAVLAAQAPPAPPEPPAQTPQAPRAPRPPRSSRTTLLTRSSEGYLGIGVAEIDAERAKALRLPEVRGVEVTRVSEGSPAEKAGLKDGDVILEYNGQRVEGTEQFQRLVRETPSGREVRLLVCRNGANQTLTATLSQRSNTYEFRMDPKFREDMEKLQRELRNQQGALQRELGNMRFHIDMPDLPSALMSWRNGMIGVEAEPLSSQLAEYFGVKEGVLVRSVNKDSPAEKAGIKAGDVITKVNDARIATPRDVTNAIRSLRPKKTFPVTVVRNRQEMTVSVTVDEQGSRAWMIPYHGMPELLAEPDRL